MSNQEIVVCHQGVGDRPRIQEALPKLWEERHSLQVVSRKLDWIYQDYEQQLKTEKEYLQSLAAQGLVTYLLSFSSAVKFDLSLLIRLGRSDCISALATVNGKLSPYNQDRFLDENPNLKVSSDTLEQEIGLLTPEMAEKTLWVRSRTDETIDKEKPVVAIGSPLERATEHVMPVDGHGQGIIRAIEGDDQVIVDFYQYKSGIVPE